MGDYITNLIQREIGADAAKVRPTMPPVYLPIADPGIVEDGPEWSTTPDLQQVAPALTRQVQKLRSANPALPMNTTRTEREAATPIDNQPRPGHSASRQGRESSVQTPSLKTEIQKTSPAAPASHHEEMAIRPAMARFSSPPAALGSQLKTNRAVASTEPAKSSHGREIASREIESVAMTPQDESTPLPVAPKSRRFAATEKGTIKPRLERLILPSAIQPEERTLGKATGPPGETTIRVSIGRIEVRANTPPTTPRKAPTPARPKMSLDDYLRQRQGGSR
jgi:hypothetical protein